MKGDFIGLVIDAMEEVLQNIGPHDNTDFDTKTYVFNSLPLRGQICGAIRYITNHNIGGILQPDEKDAITGKLVIEILCDKHKNFYQSNLDNTSCKSLEQY